MQSAFAVAYIYKKYRDMAGIRWEIVMFDQVGMYVVRLCASVVTISLLE
jgi:hypothetical protein